MVRSGSLKQGARRLLLSFGLCASLACPAGAQPTAQAPPVAKRLAVADAISMTRIMWSGNPDQTPAVVSPSGRVAAFVTFRGDLVDNRNVFRLEIADLRGTAMPRLILENRHTPEPERKYASPFEQLRFVDDRTLAFLGQDEAGHRQVFTVDILTRQVSQRTVEKNEIRRFTMAPDGIVALMSLLLPVESVPTGHQRAAQFGGFLSDRSLFRNEHWNRGLSALDPGPRLGWQWKVRNGAGYQTLANGAMGPAGLDDEVLRRFASLTGRPNSPYAIIYPYLADNPAEVLRSRFDAPYGVLSLKDGQIRPLAGWRAAAGSYENGGGNPVMAPDGRTALVFLEPWSGGEAAQAPRWMEVDLGTGAVVPSGVPAGWMIVGWRWDGQRLVLRREQTFAVVSRTAKGWGALQIAGEFPGANWRYGFTTNGDVLVGVVEGVSSPPELAVLDLRTKKRRILTRLNPGLEKRSYGAVRLFRWSHEYEPDATGFLVTPPDYQPGRRYPLVVLLDDGYLRWVREPYLLDGAMQLSAHPTQMIAAQGMMVLYTREPRKFMVGTQECTRIRTHIRAAVEALDREGMIDRKRVGLSGWSRAGYHTNCIVLSDDLPYAAASIIDGGTVEYKPRERSYSRPYWDAELSKLRTPLLVELHGPWSLINGAPMLARLDAMGRPTESLYFPTAPHDLMLPEHRRLSLQAHVDWWRYWLKDEKDVAPQNEERYRRWDEMRDRWSPLRSSPGASAP